MDLGDFDVGNVSFTKFVKAFRTERLGHERHKEETTFESITTVKSQNISVFLYFKPFIQSLVYKVG